MSNIMTTPFYAGVFDVYGNHNLRNGKSYETWFSALCHILQRSREWHLREQRRYEFSPLVRAILEDGHVPQNWHTLVLEWPHASVKDPALLSYTLNETKALADRQESAMKPARYIKRHFPQLADNVIRDLVALHTSVFKITYDLNEMLDVVQNGPYSCMKWENRDREYHPYNAYDPKHGWGMCYEKKGDQYVGRALVNKTNMEFVRTYAGDPDAGSCSANEAMRDWLVEQGFEHVSGWSEGTRLAKTPNRYGDDLFPYIDGCNQKVSDRGNNYAIDSYGEYTCTNTDGTADQSDESTWMCYHCDSDMTDDDEQYGIGVDSDEYVCERCADNYYTRVQGEHRGRLFSYLIRSNDAVETLEGDSYDEDHLPDFIVCLHNGDYTHIDRAVYVEREEEHYSVDDVVYVRGQYEVEEDCLKDYNDEWVYEGDAVVLGDMSEYAGQYAHEDDAIKIDDQWVLDSETEECSWSGEDCTAHALIDVEIEGVDYRIKPSKLQAFMDEMNNSATV